MHDCTPLYQHSVLNHHCQVANWQKHKLQEITSNISDNPMKAVIRVVNMVPPSHEKIVTSCCSMWLSWSKTNVLALGKTKVSSLCSSCSPGTQVISLEVIEMDFIQINHKDSIPHDSKRLYFTHTSFINIRKVNFEWESELDSLLQTARSEEVLGPHPKILAVMSLQMY